MVTDVLLYLLYERYNVTYEAVCVLAAGIPDFDGKKIPCLMHRMK